MCDHELLLPESIASITLEIFNESNDVRIPLQHYTSLQKLALVFIKIGDKLRHPFLTALRNYIFTELIKPSNTQNTLHKSR